MYLSSFLRSLAAVAIVFGLALWLNTSGALAQAQSRMADMQLNNDEPIQIESDRLDIAETDGTATFTGNVNVVQGQTVLKTGKLIVYYEQNKGAAQGGSAAIERLEASEKVLVQSQSQQASGDQASFDMKSEILIISGKEVVLTEGENIAVGCRLEINMKGGRAKLEGCKNGSQQKRPTIILNPKSKTNTN